MTSTMISSSVKGDPPSSASSSRSPLSPDKMLPRCHILDSRSPLVSIAGFFIGVGIVYVIQLIVLPDVSVPQPVGLVGVEDLKADLRGAGIPVEVQEQLDLIRQSKLKGGPLQATPGEIHTQAEETKDLSHRHNPMLGGLKEPRQAAFEDDDDDEYDDQVEDDKEDEKHRPMRRDYEDIKVFRGNRSVYVKKIVLVTYMRGGSTFLGEIFNQNPDSFVWFEPLDAVYSSIYGSNYGWHPPDIFFDADLNLRDIPEFEKEAILSSINSIFTCDIAALPVQVPTHSFFYFIRSVLNMRDYQSCLGDTHSWKCVRTFAKKYCPTRNFYGSGSVPKYRLSLEECHSMKVDMEQNNPLNPHMEKIYSNSRLYSRMEKEEVFNKIFEDMKNYTSCMKRVETIASVCYPRLEKACNQTAVRVIKAIRLRMRTAKQLVDGDANMVAVLMFRDPRGIIASRFKAKFISANSQLNKLREAEMLCKRMTEDYDTYTDMLVKSEYDGRILMLKYEKVAEDPTAAANRVYWTLLNHNVPEEVHRWLNASIAGTEDNGKMGTVRKNGTETANHWMHSLTKDEIVQITEICKPILQRLRYPIDLGFSSNNDTSSDSLNDTVKEEEVMKVFKLQDGG